MSSERQGSGAAGTQAGTRAALRRVIVGFRLVSAAWLTFLGAAVLAGAIGEPPARPGLVLATVAGVVLWACGTAVVAVRAPRLLSSPWWLAVDLGLAVWALVVPQAAGTIRFAGGFPFSAVPVAVYGRGVPGAVVSSGVLAAVAGWQRYQVDRSLINALNGDVLVFLLGAGVIAWGVEVLRRAERQRLASEAALGREREERRLAVERSETAAHLHDSVLQTLALLQRRAGDPAEVARLARRQERELRDWLAGSAPGDAASSTYRAAVQAAAAEVERDHRIPVEVVVVGDAPLTEGLAALVAAAREALVNAAKHAQADQVALYAEVEGACARAFVRDRGVGFDPGAHGDGGPGRGLRESIVARLDRQGGSAEIRSRPGQGTEVALTLPLPPRS
jgi:signal transduction histidine kinase